MSNNFDNTKKDALHIDRIIYLLLLALFAG